METWGLAFRYFVGFVFVLASVPKLFASGEFERVIRGYTIVPTWVVAPLSVWLPRAELVAGLSLLGGLVTRYVATLLAAALISFGAAVAVNLVRGREIDCGCFGGSARRITWLTVARNAALAVMAISASANGSTALFIGPFGVGSEAISSAYATAVLIAATSSVLLLALLEAWITFSQSASSLAEFTDAHQR